MTLLRIEDLTLRHAGAAVPAVMQATLEIAPGAAVSLIGPSGAGKTALVGALMRLAPRAEISGRALWQGTEGKMTDLLALPPARMRAVCGREIGMVFQDPATALSPVMRIGTQLTEGMRAHLGIGARAAQARAIALLRRVGLSHPEAIARAYPHQLSGGMRQRAHIAIALASAPRLLIADEPTTALDGPLRAGILDLLDSLRRETGMALLTVTHDMESVRRLGGQVVVMEAGRIVETGGTDEVMSAPRATTTRALIDAAQLGRAPICAAGAPVLDIRDLTLRYGGGAPTLQEVSLTVRRGQTLALIGASGSGKSTLARAALGLERAQMGDVRICGTAIRGLGTRAMRQLQAHVQMVFQDPVTSLDPRRALGRQVADPLINYGRSAPKARIAGLFTRVGLPVNLMDRLPHEVSGGQRQRAAIARALALEPDILVVDEGLSALDTVQAAGILALLRAEQARRGLGILFITHDLRAARAIAHRIAVMDAGRIVEEGPAFDVLNAPRHTHTRALVAASALTATAEAG
ncbi:ATP-binding cassette domain-containing protein [Roseovarius nanhaiticus]|uniref:ATP-binding cassette domain-containing protein n=1 Tax=Roseovarius nanhaiticus TaxID=573024 RepID=UPI0024906994|nr:ABC transporter ATP-binding protein [Roseovarius nanhaiticus]